MRFQNIKGPLQWLSVLTDLAMLGLTIFDLLWLMFDALYTMHTVQAFVDPILPFYRSIHQDFYVYDGIIVSIFITEFIGRWLIAIYQKTYDKWFFYPFIHWYDVLGCFPTGSFRILRLFRIIGLTYRLHKWQVIDLHNYALINILRHYYNIAIEEISDRVVIKVLEETKNEINRGQPINDAIVQEVIRPRQSEITTILSQVIQDGVREKYPQYRKLLAKHISKTVQDTVSKNPEVQQIERIPVVGAPIQQSLNSATSQIVFGVIDRLILDISAAKNQKTISLVLDSVLEVFLQHPSLQNSDLSNALIIDSIDLIVKRVQVKQWKNAAL
ncbi:ion transporter [Aureispira anguillae]|uniref:ion transporter n=1 Tax=Aureispira anguillae TaxID=2864201 RepID=UPI002232BB46|nr:ion transporter [Aureispira anguillae]